MTVKYEINVNFNEADHAFYTMCHINLKLKSMARTGKYLIQPASVVIIFKKFEPYLAFTRKIFDRCLIVIIIQTSGMV